MTKFKFDIGNMNSRCEKVRTNISKYKNICEQTYISAKSITNSWNDPASEAFFNKVQNEELKVSEIYNSLEEYQKNIEYFGNELSSIFSNKGYSTNGLVVNYDTYHIDRAKGEFDTVKNPIRTAQKAFEDCVIPYGFDNLPILNEIFNALYNDIGALAGSIENKLNDTRKQVNDLINTTQTKNNSVQFVTIDDRLTQVNANTVYMNPTFKSLDNESIKVSTQNNITNLEYKEEELKDVEAAVVSNFNGNSEAELTLESNEDVILNGNINDVTNINMREINDNETEVSNVNITNTSLTEKNLEDEEEVSINPNINEINTDIAINKEIDEVKISEDAIKTNLQDINIRKNDDNNISVDTIKVNNDVGLVNLKKDVSANIESVNTNVSTNTNVNIEKGVNADIDSIISDIKSNTNMNIEKGNVVTAEDILNETK